MSREVRMRAEGAGFAYDGEVVAVQGVDLEVRGGETLALIGPNGAGKSTLLRLFSGLLRPSRGQVVLGDGGSLEDLPPRDRARRVAFVPQSLLALPPITVTEFVLGGRYPYYGVWRNPSRHDRELAAEAIAQCDVAYLAERPMTTLSGGERQRALVARAIAQQSDIVLCDEPTAALDLDHQLEILDLLAGLAESGRAVVFVTHQLNLAAQYGNRLALMQCASIRAEGTPEEILTAEVLGPVYGDRVFFAQFPDGSPLVAPRRR